MKNTPPVLPATDATLMAPRTDGTLLVIKSGNTERKITKDAMENFRNANLPILGTILNFVDLKKEDIIGIIKSTILLIMVIEILTMPES